MFVDLFAFLKGKKMITIHMNEDGSNIMILS